MFIPCLLTLIAARRVQGMACPGNGRESIADIIRADLTGQLSVFSEAVEAADVATLLSVEGPINVVAPDNSAFEGFLQETNATMEQLLSQTNVLDLVIRYHVVNDELGGCDGGLSGTFSTMLGGGESLIFNGETIIDEKGNTANLIASVPASNGRLFVVDRVLRSTVADVFSDAELGILLDAFDAIDESEDERITVDEFVEAAAQRGVILTTEQIEDWIAADEDDSSDLDFGEFMDTL